MSDLVNKEVVIRAIKDYLIDLIERKINTVDVLDFNVDIQNIVKKFPTENEWIPVEYEIPADDRFVLLSFSNFSQPLIGRYEQSDDGGAWYIGDCDGEDTCVANDLFVNAWMPLPECYEVEQ